MLGRVIAASPELQERELVKRAAPVDKIAAALWDRGTAEPTAGVTAWTAVAVFFVARDRWNQAATHRRSAELINRVLNSANAVWVVPRPVHRGSSHSRTQRLLASGRFADLP
jgi:hypothetical protein